MKRLRRFNESKSGIDYDYIYDCFNELLDDSKAEIREFENDWTHYITIDLKTNPTPDARGGTTQIEKSKIFDYINDIKYNNGVLQEVESSLRRLSDKYPSYKVNFEQFIGSIHINIFAAEEIGLKL